MHRRDLLKFTAFAGATGSSCASLLNNPAAAAAGDMSGLLSALDDALAGIRPAGLIEALVPGQRSPEVLARMRSGEELTRKTLRTLLLVGTVGELTPEQQLHEGVQRRLREHMGEIDDAMFGMTEYLEGVSPSERAQISKALVDDPNLGMRIMGAFDQEAAAMGISLKQRTKLRSISALACSRLRQSPDLAINEYTGKVRKVAARHGARAAQQRQAAAAIGDAMFWQQVDATADAPATGGAAAPAAETRPPLVDAPSCTTSSDCRDGLSCQNHRDLGDGKWSQGQCLPGREKPRVSVGFLTAGGVVMGLGAVLAGLTLSSGALAVTLGAVIGGLGLLVVVIGLILLASGN